MGAGAAGVIAATEFDLFAQKKKRQTTTKSRIPSTKKSTRAGFLKWPVIHDEPSTDAFVTAIFSGLVGFCYDDNNTPGFIDVGFHPGEGNHHLQIDIYRNPGCQLIKTLTPGPKDLLELGQKQQGSSPNVFQTAGPFDRNKTGGSYDHDFRWLPDLDSADFYPEGYAKNAKYGTRLKVTDGTLYTRLRSNSTFKLIDANLQDCEDEIRDFGHVELYMALAINTKGTVYLTGADPFIWAQGVSYQIVFRNECHNCLRTANDCDEMKRNDFHFNRKVVKVPGGRIKYALQLKESCAGNCATPDFCYTPHPPPRTTDDFRVSDESPCMGSGFGRTPGFP